MCFILRILAKQNTIIKCNYNNHRFKEKMFLLNEIHIFIFVFSGNYECKLNETGGFNIFRQKSNGVLTFKVLPYIRMVPESQSYKCDKGHVLTVECSVQDPYIVQFQNKSSITGKHNHKATIFSVQCTLSSV